MKALFLVLIQVLWDVVQHRLVNCDWCFRGA